MIIRYFFGWKSPKWATPTKLPLILPIVLYNGEDKWTARTNIKELIPSYPVELSGYLPSLPYLVLSEQHYDDEKLDLQTQNFVKALFRLEKSRNSQDLSNVIKRLSKWLNSHDYDSLRKAFTVFVKRIILPRRFKHQPEVLSEIRNLQEMSMLADRIDSWLDEAEQRGFEKGRTELSAKMDIWLEEAEQKGIAQGIQQGVGQGIQQGIGQGKAETLQELLELKFGDLSAETVEYIHSLPMDKLKICLSRLFAAQRLEDVLTLED